MNRTTMLALAALYATGCSTDTDLTNRPLFDNGTNVFEAQVVDGLTGAKVEMAHVSVQVGRHVLEADGAETGTFTVYGIPYGQFRVSVDAPTYNDFQALKSFQLGSQFASLSDGDPLVYYFNNIVMYPKGTVPQGITVHVYDGTNGAPVPNATVVATLESVGAPIPVANVLAPNVGLLPSTLTATSDPTGTVQLMADTLVIGGNYQIDVFGALDAQGVYLVPEFNQTITVGQDVQEVLVFLSRPFLYPVALLASNEDNQIHANLKITFPYAIDVCSDPSFHTWFNSTSPQDPNFNGVFARPATTGSVTLALANNDTELTLTHVAAPTSDDPADDLRVTFSGISVRPKGASLSSCTSLTSVALRDTSGGLTLNTEIRIRDLP